RARRLKPEEYQGGASAISNLGMYGIEEFTAVINPPQTTILAVGTGEQRPVVRDGKITIATQMKITLSCDHRAIDGATGAELIGEIKRFIESPTAMLVLTAQVRAMSRWPWITMTLAVVLVLSPPGREIFYGAFISYERFMQDLMRM